MCIVVFFLLLFLCSSPFSYIYSDMFSHKIVLGGVVALRCVALLCVAVCCVVLCNRAVGWVLLCCVVLC